MIEWDDEEAVYIFGEAVRTSVDEENISGLRFYIEPGLVLTQTKSVGDRILIKASDQVETINTLGKIYTDTPKPTEMVLLDTGLFNYSRDGIDTFDALYTNIFLIDVLGERRYFILCKEYTQKAFYEYLALKPALHGIAEQFRAYDNVYDEKKELENNIQADSLAPLKNLKI